MAHDDSIKAAYGEWLALTQAERLERDLPSTKAAFGRAYGVTPKTLRRWEADDPVVETARNRTEARTAAIATAASDDAPESTTEALDRLKEDLLNKALRMDEKAIEQFMKWFGKDALEEERRARQAGVKSMTDEELVDATLTLIGREAVEAWLEGQRG